MWVWFIIICIVLYSLNNSEMKISNQPIWMWVIGGFIVFHLLMYLQDNEYFTNDSAPTKPSKGKEFIVYNFNTSWCGWSKKFQTEWNIFSDKVKMLKDINIKAIDVKCDEEDNKTNQDLCKKYNVPGYPYIIILVNNEPRAYDGERTSEALLRYIQTLFV